MAMRVLALTSSKERPRSKRASRSLCPTDCINPQATHRSLQSYNTTALASRLRAALLTETSGNFEYIFVRAMYKPNRLNSLRTLAEVLLPILPVFLVPGPAFSRTTSAHASPSPAFQGSAALAYTRRATSFGERPSGSEALVHL